jgi:hypothetical protein
LIEYIGGKKNLIAKVNLLGNLRAIERYAKIHYPFFKKEWDFARLLYIDSNMSMKNFLLQFNSSIVLSGMFGSQYKRIDVCVYEKLPFGRFGKNQEFDETLISLKDIYDLIMKKNFVVMIYDTRM